MRALCLLLLCAAGTASAQPFPGLHFEPPAGFSGAPSGDPAIYREHLPRQYREEKSALRPSIQRISVQGAEAAYLARLNGRSRILIVVPGHVALLDYQAQDPAAYARNWPAVETMLKMMKVTAGG